MQKIRDEYESNIRSSRYEELERTLIKWITMVRENNVSLTDAIHMLVAAWDLVKPETLKNCFRKAGWKKASEPIGGRGEGEEEEEDEDEEDEIRLSVLQE